MKSLPDYEEEIDRVLQRAHINISEVKTIREFQALIRGYIGPLQGGFLAATSQYFTKYAFAFENYKVKSVPYERLGVPQIRYVIGGQRGLFGIAKARAFVLEQMNK